MRDDEAELICQAADRLLAGESLRGILRDWNEQGITTTTGRTWAVTAFRRMLTSARVAGDREHHGVVTHADAWPAILDRSTSARVRAVLSDPSRRRKPGPAYLLTGLVRCGRCGAVMVGRPVWRGGKRLRRYFCAADPPVRVGCNSVGIVAEPLEELVSEAGLVALDAPVVPKALSRKAEPKNGAEAALRALEGREAELASMWASGTLTKTAWSAARDQLAKELEAARARVAGRVTEDAAVAYAGKGASLRKRWPDLSTDQRRAVIGAVVEAVTIAPVTRRDNRFDDKRVSITRRV